MKTIDLTGQKFGKWQVIKRSENKKNNQIYWVCKCECGTFKEVNGTSLRSGTSTNCGCVRRQKMSNKRQDLGGQKFNSLTVIEKANNGKWKCQCDCGDFTYVSTTNLKSGHVKHCQKCGYKISGLKRSLDLTGQQFGQLKVISRSENKNTKWICQCDCGNITEVEGTSLKQGLTQSCGCLKSKGEKKIIQLLLDNNILFEYQKTFDTCIFSNTKKRARFDFYVNSSYIIEYDGEQHYRYTNNGWCSQENFEALQLRDKEKNQWCWENRIPLIRIPYFELERLTIKDLILETSKFVVNEQKPIMTEEEFVNLYLS